MPTQPLFSAVVVSPGRCDAVAPLLRRLRSQTIRDQMEIVLVGPEITELDAGDRLLAEFSFLKTVSNGPLVSMAAARAAGVLAASGRYVSFTEEHCFPENDWAQAIVDAFERHDADMVGPVFINANPKLALSWAIFLQEYGHWMAPHPGGWMDHLPGHNSTYRRDQLLALGDRLIAGIEAESALHFEWRTQGRRLWLEPRARVRHVNLTNARAVLISALAFQRPWANSRALNWSLPRRLLYALGSPLIPIVRFPGVWAAIRRTGLAREQLPRVLSWSAMCLAASAFGEFLGYAGSTGNADATLVEVELYRKRYLARRDNSGRGYFK